jgi:hypothetical protein
MAKVQKITDHARKVLNKDSTYYAPIWKCKYCDYQTRVRYEDYKNLRAHLSRKHPMEYKPYTINEEADHEDHVLSVLRA